MPDYITVKLTLPTALDLSDAALIVGNLWRQSVDGPVEIGLIDATAEVSTPERLIERADRLKRASEVLHALIERAVPEVTT